MSDSAAVLSRVLAVFGLSLLLGASLLLTTQWAIASFRPTLVEIDNLKHKLSIARPKRAQDRALHRQGLPRQTREAGNSWHAAVEDVQPPEQWLENATQQTYSQHSAFDGDLRRNRSISQPPSTDLDVQHSQQGSHKGNDTAEAAPRTQALSANETDRCRTVLGDWCQHALRQHDVLPRKQPPSSNLSCHADCNGVGNCNAITGTCDCPAGGSISHLHLTRCMC